MSAEITPSSDEESLISGYLPDQPSGADFLGITEDVDRLATLLMSRNVAPPISIGLFGEEGSGKTFFAHRLFMRISDIDQTSHRAGESSAFCAGAIQVVYNAWHNVGSNPWIGLAEAIFSELDKSLRKRHSMTSARSDETFVSIRTARKLLNELEYKLERADRLYKQTRMNYESTSQAHDQALHLQAQHQAKSKWVDVENSFAQALDERASSEIDWTGNALGLAQLSRTPERLENVLEQAKTLGGRASLLTSSQKAKQYFGTFFLIFAAVLVTLLMATIGIRLYVSDPDVENWLNNLRNFFAIITAGLAIIGGLAALIVRSRASLAIETLQNYEALLREIIRKVDQEKAYDLSIAAHNVESQKSLLEDAKMSLFKSEEQRTIADQSIKDFKREGVLRRVSDYYRAEFLATEAEERPGLIPTIREDFEDLTRILTEQNQEAIYHDSNSLDIERIIVYVEDLDQCPGPTIIALLQAVHLLLAFPLFAVVLVGNPRRLLEAVKTQYLAHQTRDPMQSALSYLNKLIQIPFWMRPLDSASARSLVHGLISHVTAEPQIPEIARPVGEEKDAEDKEPVSTAETEAEISPGFSDAIQREVGQFTADEVHFLESLVELVAPSPRDIKRLVNIYLLIRSGQTSERLSELLGIETGPPAYPAVLTQLAIVIAFPLEAVDYFKILDGISRQPDVEFGHFYAALEEHPNLSNSENLSVILTLLEKYRGMVGENRSLRYLRAWSSEVMRYSLLPVALPAGRA